MKKFYLILIFCFLQASVLLAQNPKIVLQRNFGSGINNIHRSPGGQFFVVEEGTITKKYSLWDQSSKLMLGKIQMEPGNGQGAGHIQVLENGEILVASNYEIKKVDLISSKIETFLKIIEYPEMHLKFKFLPWDSTKLLLSTKIYGEKDKLIADVTNKGRLLIYDLYKKAIIHQMSTNYEITAIAFNDKNKTIALGTNNGDYLLLDSFYQEFERQKLFSNPVLFLDNSMDNSIIAAANLGEDHSFYRAEGILYFFNRTEKKLKKIKLKKEAAKFEKESVVKYGDDNLINNLLVDSKKQKVYVNYGYSKVDVIHLADFEQKPLRNLDYQSITFVNFNKDSTRLLVAFGKINLLHTSNRLSYYDLETQKQAFVFKTFESPKENMRNVLAYDNNGNYHFITQNYKKGSFFSTDTMKIFSGNDVLVKELICDGCNFQFNSDDNSLVIFNDSKIITGQFHPENLQETRTTFQPFKKNGAEMPSCAIYSDTSAKNLKSLIPKEQIWDVCCITKDSVQVFISRANTYESNYFINVLADNQITYKHKVYGFGSSPMFKSSRNKNFLAFIYQSKKKEDVIMIYDLQKKKILHEITCPEYSLTYYDFDVSQPSFYFSKTIRENGEYVGTFLFKVDLLNPLKEEQLVAPKQEFFRFVANEKKQLVAGELYNDVFIYHIAKNKLIYKERTPFSINKVGFNKQMNAFSFDLGNELMVYKDTSLQLNFFEFNNNKEAILSSKGYYYASKDALKNFAYAYNNKGFSATDFDLYLNRPDIIYQMLGGKNENYLHLLKKTIEKRNNKYLQKSRGANILFSARKPKIRIKNINQIPDYTLDDSLKLEVEVQSTGVPVAVMFVSVNEVPGFGKNGIKLALEQQKLPLAIKLSEGKNKIQLFCEDEQGLPSLMETLEITKGGDKKQNDLYLVSLNVANYQQTEMNLKYAVKDGRDLVNMFAGNQQNIFKNCYVDTLFNENVTLENVSKVKEKLLASKVDDVVILFVSGHGLLDDKLDFYFASHNMDFDHPAKYGIAYDLLENLLDSIPARKKLMLIDACHSGETDKEDLKTQLNKEVALTDGSKGTVSVPEGSKGGKSKVSINRKKTGLQNSFELMQQLFADLSRSSGAVVLSAAAGEGYALESAEWNNGAFTYSLLSGLKTGLADANIDNKITVTELKEYVINKVVEITNGRQKPTVRNDNLEFDFRVW